MSASLNVWIVAGSSVYAPYPCRCQTWRREGCDPTWCPCAGRTDVAHFAPGCCAWVNTPPVAAAAQRAYEARNPRG